MGGVADSSEQHFATEDARLLTKRFRSASAGKQRINALVDEAAASRVELERRVDAAERAKAEAALRASEEALRESEERLRLIVASASDYAILTSDPSRRVTS